ncbi:hypothetical protein GN958_ATG21103 [Phytophthora infestans]|uniref:Uncharacterized protein n=1 Tax=Phytophthora infestans TaxID=4787 RepID=A0A8S9TUG6_PHYIN|nr:hypothetical protein GN958_ATG21103 [Phytophthora infestans]
MFPFRYDVHWTFILRKRRGGEQGAQRKRPRMTRQLGIPGQQARRIGLRPVQAVDYVRAVQGIAKDHSIDEDYNEEEERADGGDAGAVDAMVNANAVYAVDNVNDTDDADTVAVEDDDKKLFGDSDDDVDDLVRNDGAATGADKRLSVDAAGDASTGVILCCFARAVLLVWIC